MNIWVLVVGLSGPPLLIMITYKCWTGAICLIICGLLLVLEWFDDEYVSCASVDTLVDCIFRGESFYSSFGGLQQWDRWESNPN